LLVRIAGAGHSPSEWNFSVDSDQLPRLDPTYFAVECKAMKSAANDGYGPVAKTLHWVTVFLVIIAWTLGMFGEEPAEESAQGSGLLTHIWIGLTILVVALVRIPWRVANPPPKIVPTEFGRWLVEWTDPASRLMHYVLYGLLVMVPALGIALQFAQGHSLPLFWLVEIPSPWLADKAFAHSLKEFHEISANLLVILAVFHMAAALVHHIVFGDNTLRRMLPHLRKQS
jgi:cytochrome b561